MTDPENELIIALRNALLADAAVTALVDDRIYDEIPSENGKKIARFPYISFGSVEALRADVECYVANDYTVQIDVWSREYGRTEASAIRNACKRALHGADLSVPDNALSNVYVERTLWQREPNGITKHAILTVGAIVEER